MKKLLQTKNLLKALLFVNAFAFANFSNAQIEAPKDGCLGKEISFSTKSSGRNFTWDFGSFSDSKNNVGSEGSSTFTRAGKYTVSVTYTEGGKSVTETFDITITDCCTKPVAINTSTDSICLGSLLGVTGANVGAGYSYSWSFGSGSSSATSSGVGTHYVSYSTTGVKTISLTVAQTCKCGDCPDTTITKNIFVKSSPSLSISGPSGCLYNNTAHTFTGTSSGSLVWSAGDGSMSGNSTTKNITWSTAGAKLVCVTSTLNGCAVSECLSVDIIDNTCPTASINGAVTGCQYAAIGISAVNQGFGTSYFWDFGSGVQSVSGSTTNKSVKYNTAGTKTIRLITTKCGCTNDTTFHTLEIKPTPTVSVTGVNCGVANTNYVFSSTPSPLSGVSYSWTTSGGTGSSTTTSITNSWSTTGSKSICLTASLNGCATTSCKQVNIVAAACPTASFNIPSAQCANTNLNLSATDQGFGTNYTWSYNGSTYSGMNSTITLVGSGVQAIVLTVSNCNCANSTITKYITVNQAPTVALTGPANGYENVQYSYTTTFISGAVYTWTVDGIVQSSVTNNMNYTFTSVGYKSICVTVNSGSCSSSDCMITGIILNTCPKALINAVTSTCQGSTVTISATDQGCFVEYDWLIAGVASTGISNHVTFNTPGTYDIRLIITPCGCTSCARDTAYTTITVNPTPTADISGPTTGLINTNYTFTTPANSGATYTWNTGGGTGSSTTNTISLSWSTPGSKTICVDVALNGCITQDCHTIVIANNDTCANPAKLEFKQLNVSTHLNDTFIVDGGNTIARTFVEDNNNSVLVFATDTIYVRNGIKDTTAYTKLDFFEPKMMERIVFNHAVNKLEFSIFDLDHDELIGNKILTECVTVNAYSGASIVQLTAAEISLGSFITQNGTNTYCNLVGLVDQFMDFGDLDFHFSQTIDSVHIIAKIDISNGYNNVNPDFGISDLDHCSVVPVPVTWLNVAANRIDDQKVSVDWSTASEINNDLFEIERSINGSKFEKIAIVNGNGNTSSITNYTFVDNVASAQNICYRIKQVDFDQNSSYSAIACTQTAKQFVQVFPNPSTGKVNIISSNLFTEGQEITVYDLKGTQVYQTEVTEKRNNVSLDLNILESGIYIISYKVNGNLNLSKIVITK